MKTHEIPFSLGRCRPFRRRAVPCFCRTGFGGFAALNLTLFDLLDGASLTSGSGHLYPTDALPLSAAVWLLGSGMLGLLGFTRRRAVS